MDNELWVILLPITLLPVFFAMGWFAARIDMKTVLKQAKSVPAGFYKSLDALVDRNSGRAARELAEVIDQQPQSYDLNLTLGKLYRQRGENDKAINMHQALLDSPDTVNEKRARVLFELAQNYQSAGLVDRAEQIFIGLQEGNMAREARQHLLSIYQQDRDWEKAIETAQLLSHDEQTYQFEIAQFYCELAQTALFKSNLDAARYNVQKALDANKKCARANMILGDIETKQGNFPAAVEAYGAIEQQNHAYLSMVGEKTLRSLCRPRQTGRRTEPAYRLYADLPRFRPHQRHLRKNPAAQRRKRSRPTCRRTRAPKTRPQRRVPPAGFENQHHESRVESRRRHDAFRHRPPTPTQRHVPLPQLPLQIPSLLLALPRLQQMGNLHTQ